jgi:hypothetical protein
MRLYIGLIHYPVYNKNDQEIASSITNLDLHDLARLARTYGVKTLFVITPLQDQQKIAERIILHWTKGYGAKYNIKRKEAIRRIDISWSLEESIEKIKDLEGERPLLIATDASEKSRLSMTFSRAKEIMNSAKAVFILFGTAWGLHKDIIDSADFILEPIKGSSNYNHLSVRTAAGIILDRLVGR